MEPQALSFARLSDVCRDVDDAGFDLRADGDIVVRRYEDPPAFGAPVLLFDEADAADARRLLGEMNGAGRKDSFLAHLSDAVLVPDVLGVIARGGRFLFPNSYCEWGEEEAFEYYFTRSMHLRGLCKHGPGGAREREYFLEPRPGAEVVEVEEPTLLLANQSSNNYWHFMTEVFPRLHHFERHPELASCVAVVRRKNDPFEAALSRFSGIPTSRMTALDWGRIYRFKHLIFPSALGDRAISRAKIDWVRRRFGLEDKPLSGPGRRLYLSRSDRGARRILNEDQVTGLLAKFGFETLIPSSLSLEEQARTFSQAEIVVGPHGAALTNIAFMPPGAAAVEIASRRWATLFYTLASARDVRYFAVGSQWDFHSASAQGRTDPFDPAAMLVDVDRLRRALETAEDMVRRRPAR